MFPSVAGGSLLLTSCRGFTLMLRSTLDIAVCRNPTIDELFHNGRVRLSPGGTALFASCAAGYLGARVGILGNIGEDYPPTILRRLRTLHIDVRFLRKTAGHSTRFHITATNGSRTLRLLEPGDKIVATASTGHFRAVHVGPVCNEVTRALR